MSFEFVSTFSACPAIQAPKNSDLKCTVNITQPRCAVQCHEGFKIPSQHSSQDFATCLGNGTWDSPLPACVPKGTSSKGTTVTLAQCLTKLTQ